MKKSKIQYKAWIISIGATVVGMYMIFLWGKILEEDAQTIQIIRQEGGVFNEKSSHTPMEGGDIKKGEYSFVASKKGVYYYPVNCSRAKTLSIKNMLYFKDKMSAQQAGYKPHKDCF